MKKALRGSLAVVAVMVVTLLVVVGWRLGERRNARLAEANRFAAMEYAQREFLARLQTENAPSANFPITSRYPQADDESDEDYDTRLLRVNIAMQTPPKFRNLVIEHTHNEVVRLATLRAKAEEVASRPWIDSGP